MGGRKALSGERTTIVSHCLALHIRRHPHALRGALPRERGGERERTNRAPHRGRNRNIHKLIVDIIDETALNACENEIRDLNTLKTHQTRSHTRMSLCDSHRGYARRALSRKMPNRHKSLQTHTLRARAFEERWRMRVCANNCRKSISVTLVCC